MGVWLGRTTTGDRTFLYLASSAVPAETGSVWRGPVTAREFSRPLAPAPVGGVVRGRCDSTGFAEAAGGGPSAAAAFASREGEAQMIDNDEPRQPAEGPQAMAAAGAWFPAAPHCFRGAPSWAICRPSSTRKGPRRRARPRHVVDSKARSRRAYCSASARAAGRQISTQTSGSPAKVPSPRPLLRPAYRCALGVRPAHGRIADGRCSRPDLLSVHGRLARPRQIPPRLQVAAAHPQRRRALPSGTARGLLLAPPVRRWRDRRRAC